MYSLLGLLLILLQLITLAYLVRQNDHPFVISLSCLLAFHLDVAMTLQVFGVFVYQTVMWTNVLLVLLLAAVASFQLRKSTSIRKDFIELFRLDWVELFIFVSALIFLLSVAARVKPPLSAPSPFP